METIRNENVPFIYAQNLTRVFKAGVEERVVEMYD